MSDKSDKWDFAPHNRQVILPMTDGASQALNQSAELTRLRERNAELWKKVVAVRKSWSDFADNVRQKELREAKARITLLEATVRELREALVAIDSFDVNANASMVNQVFRLKNMARLALATAESVVSEPNKEVSSYGVE